MASRPAATAALSAVAALRRFTARSFATEAATTSAPPSFPVPVPADDLPLPDSLFDASTPTPAPTRMLEHYERTLATDLLYLTYNHKDPAVREWLPATKYVPGKTERNAAYKKHEVPRYRDTAMRKPHPARTGSNQPALDSVVVHSFLKDSIDNKYVLLNALTQLEAITGKYPDIVRSKSNVALWKLREGAPVGVKVELRGDDMWHFVDKLAELVMPRLKNWYGISATTGDGLGNVKIGFEPKVMSYFPEIEQAFDRYPFMCGFDIVFRTSAYSDWEARALLSGLQIPIENAASKAKREKYLQKATDNVDPNEPEWMRFKRAREAAENKKNKKK
ncbi:ribosomal protein L5 domain-containing protein [Blastocladiella britannica]|nr:ribosomal protein L5 domain-containing protein [Blastocladiella britannica]